MIMTVMMMMISDECEGVDKKAIQKLNDDDASERKETKIEYNGNQNDLMRCLEGGGAKPKKCHFFKTTNFRGFVTIYSACSHCTEIL